MRQIATFLNIDLSDEQVERVVVANTFKNKKKEGGLSNALVLRKGTVSSGGTKGSNAHVYRKHQDFGRSLFLGLLNC